MRWIATRTILRRRLGDEEQGATAVMVALLLLVLVGIGAFVLDIGNQMWETRMQQNSADAAALAVARDCAEGDCGSEDEYQAVAQEYAENNTSRGSYGIVVENQTSDEPWDGLSHDTGEVTVRAETGDSSGADTFSTWLATVIDDDLDRLSGWRTATVQWGAAVAAEGFPFGVCREIWEANNDPLPGPPSLDIHYKGPSSNPPVNDCLESGQAQQFSGGTQPGNFSWLQTENGSCNTYFDFSDGSYLAKGDTGASAPADCSEVLDDMFDQIQNHKDEVGDIVHPEPEDNDLPTVVLPVYSEVVDPGNNAEYRVETFAAFEFSGLKISGNKNVVVDSWIDESCTGGGGNNLCVQGRFIQEIVPDGEIDPGADGDVIVIKLVG